MSWFSQVGQGSYQQQPAGSQTFSTTNMGSTFSPTGPIVGPATPDSGGAALSPFSLLNFPPVPQGASTPLSLENLSCASQSVREPDPISYVTLQEQRCVLSWFQGWTSTQRERFLHDLLGKAVPGKVCTLLDSLSTLQVKDKLPNIFECQLRLWTQWFESWGEEERNHFLHMLEEQDPEYVAHFYRSVAGTAGRD
uniref:Chromosome 14 open reading frame 119 n=1 Tax=Iconisemion striatum TaxID=60296 RepID=A0A1A7YX67_9TELE